jgi:hypothetical protein
MIVGQAFDEFGVFAYANDQQSCCQWIQGTRMSDLDFFNLQLSFDIPTQFVHRIE